MKNVQITHEKDTCRDQAWNGIDFLFLGQKHGVTTVLNAAPARADLAPEILENTDILVLNQTEAEIISGITGTGCPTKHDRWWMVLNVFFHILY